MIITFDPIIHDKVWGTEEWLLTEENVPNNIPKSLWEMIKVEAWGSKNPNRDKFPLALKVIDAKENLSLQVHPDKNELWWILEAKEGSKISVGGNTMSAMEEAIEAKAGHSISIPQGAAHMLGAGVKVFELADCLGTTYRIYDHGRDRELQIDQAIQYIQPSLRPELVDENNESNHAVKWYNADLYRPSYYTNIRFPIMPIRMRKQSTCEDYQQDFGPLTKIRPVYVANGETFYYHYVLEGQVECEGQFFEKGSGFLVTSDHRIDHKGYMLNGKAEILTVSFL